MPSDRKFFVCALAFGLLACGERGQTPASDSATVAPPAPPAATATTPAGLNGEAEYGAVCIACHQADGKGLPSLYPPLAGSEHINGDPSIPIAIVLHGLQGPVTVAGQSFNNLMTPWSQLSDAQIAAILTYERSSWGNSASAVTPAMVASVRSATSSRNTPWTIDELKKAKLN